MKVKYLCLCEGGNMRSVALATELKQRYRVDALAAGVVKNSPATIALLCDWADVVVLLSENLRGLVPVGAAAKIRILEVGPDRFGRPNHPELIQLVRDGLARWMVDGSLPITSDDIAAIEERAPR